MPTVNINASGIVAYARYEPRVLSRDLASTIKASVHDALWMLTQQFRVGEFKGEDAGTISKARVVSQSHKLNRFQGRNMDRSQAFEESIPLEAKIERLPLKADLGLRLEFGNIWLKLLRKAFPAEATDALYQIRKSYAIEAVEGTEVEKMSNLEAMRIRSLATSRAIDGVRLYEFIQEGGDVNEIVGGNPDLTNVADRFVKWIKRTYHVPGSPEEHSWSDTQLEYQCAVSAPLDSSAGANEYVLLADKYTRGNLDWYSFDLHQDSAYKLSSSSSVPIDNGNALLPQKVQSYIPQTLEFKGMPKERWWAFEDSNNDLSKMLTQKHDVVKMVVMEFGLIYSNDWFIIPHRIQDNTITAIDSLVTTDVFGRQYLVQRAGEATSQQWHKWDMYNLTTNGADDTKTFGKLVMIPAIKNRMEGSPTEKVMFLRDEMANMAWGVEEVVPNELLSGMDGRYANNELQKYLQSIHTAPPENDYVKNDASFRYNISNSVPENWIPFIPKKVDGAQFALREVMLQRATFERYVNGAHTGEFVRPRTSILNVGLEDVNNQEPYLINEEEVSRTGFVVSTHFQRARWYDGKTYTWLGRKVLSGRGEGNSGLKFDILVDKDPDE